MKLINIGINHQEGVPLTMEQFPSLKEDGPTQPHDIDHASVIIIIIIIINLVRDMGNTKG